MTRSYFKALSVDGGQVVNLHVALSDDGDLGKLQSRLPDNISYVTLSKQQPFMF